MTDFDGDRCYLLESVSPRCTLLSTLKAQQNLSNVLQDSELGISCGIEILVLDGQCRIDHCRTVQDGTGHSRINHSRIDKGNPDDEQDSTQRLCTGSYLRLPKLHPTHLLAETDCTVFIKLNQFLDGDEGERTIDTKLPEKWLPGPVEGIEIRPLHVFDTESIMLLRWQHAAEFTPRLNPQGEEILVISGLLQNRDHLYRPHHWIRNPIEDWRRWHGNTGTLIYYKSGHFPPNATDGCIV